MSPAFSSSHAASLHSVTNIPETGSCCCRSAFKHLISIPGALLISGVNASLLTHFLAFHVEWLQIYSYAAATAQESRTQIFNEVWLPRNIFFNGFEIVKVAAEQDSELFIESSNGLNFPECSSLPGQPRWRCAQTLCFPALIAPLQAVKAIMKSKRRHFISFASSSKSLSSEAEWAPGSWRATLLLSGHKCSNFVKSGCKKISKEILFLN